MLYPDNPVTFGVQIYILAQNIFTYIYTAALYYEMRPGAIRNLQATVMQ